MVTFSVNAPMRQHGSPALTGVPYSVAFEIVTFLSLCVSSRPSSRNLSSAYGMPVRKKNRMYAPAIAAAKMTMSPNVPVGLRQT